MGGAVFETSSLEALRAFNETQRRVLAACSLQPAPHAHASRVVVQAREADGHHLHGLLKHRQVPPLSLSRCLQ